MRVKRRDDVEKLDTYSNALYFAVICAAIFILFAAMRPAHSQTSYFGPVGGAPGGMPIARCAPGYITKDPACNRPPQPPQRASRASKKQ
jgi:hypothetical protein